MGQDLSNFTIEEIKMVADEFTMGLEAPKKPKTSQIDSEGNWTCQVCFNKNLSGCQNCLVCKAEPSDEVKSSPYFEQDFLPDKAELPQAEEIKV